MRFGVDLPPSLYLGGGKSLVKLGNGRLLCIDGQSPESLRLITGEGVEPQLVALFLSYLSPDSVVLDIGAGFGYFTTLAAPLLSETGSIHAFEADPRTYQCLLRSLQANALFGRPNVSLAHAALLPGDGEAGREPVAEMFSRMADAATPLRPTLIRINAGTGATSVLDSLRPSLERSPEAKIIVTGLPDDPDWTARFHKHARELGLSACRIRPDASLEWAGHGSDLAGERHLLLTRTPAAEVARFGRSVALASLRLPDEQAVLGEGGILWEQRFVPPFRPLAHGPYLYALPGRYDWRIEGVMAGTCHIRLQTDFGRTILAEMDAGALPVEIPFELRQLTDTLEIMICDAPGLRALHITGMSLRHRL